jgi:hypothetical protein
MGEGAPSTTAAAQASSSKQQQAATSSSKQQQAATPSHQSARSTQHAARSTQHAARSTQHAARSTQHATRTLRHGGADFRVHHAFDAHGGQRAAQEAAGKHHVLHRALGGVHPRRRASEPQPLKVQVLQHIHALGVCVRVGGGDTHERRRALSHTHAGFCECVRDGCHVWDQERGRATPKGRCAHAGNASVRARPMRGGVRDGARRQSGGR